jgi:hypothetical protein
MVLKYAVSSAEIIFFKFNYKISLSYQESKLFKNKA